MSTLQRSYNSPLREEQTELTRQLILEALGEQLTDRGLEDFSIPKVARRARLAVRTVYRYFPTRERLLDAVADWLDQRIGRPQPPARAEELVALVPRLFQTFADHAGLIQSLLLGTRKGRQVRQRANLQTAEKLAQAVAAHAPGLPDEARVETAALLQALVASPTLFLLTDTYGFDVERAARAVQRIMRLVLEAARRGEID